MSQTRNEIEAALIDKAQNDSAFRQALLTASRAAIQQEFGISLPAGMQLVVVEESLTVNYLILPALVSEQLPDAELESISGGWLGTTHIAGWKGRLAKTPAAPSPVPLPYPNEGGTTTKG